MIEAVTFVCYTRGCAWERREREMRLSLVNMGQGLLGSQLVVCECGTIPERVTSRMLPDVSRAGP